MARIADGVYVILSAADQELAVDVQGANRSSGANVQLFERQYYDSQRWQVTNAGGDTYRIVSAFSGMALSASADFSNVVQRKLYAGGDPADPALTTWTVSDSGSDAEVDGAPYDAFWVALTGSTARMDVAVSGGAAASGDNVNLHAPSASDGQKWVFLPSPLLREGGVYSIRSMLDVTMCLDTVGSQLGANVLLFKHSGRSNGQKWALLDQGSGRWAVRNVGNGRCLHLTSETPSDGTNVNLWEAETPACSWVVTEYGEAAVGGGRAVEVAFAAANDTSYLLDAVNSLASSSSNVGVWSFKEGTEGNRSQRWALVPESAIDDHMPVPGNIGVAAAVGSPGSSSCAARGTVYPVWDCTDAWATGGPNSYLWEYRVSYLGLDGVWDPWGPFGGARTADVVFDRASSRSWVAAGIPGDYDRSRYRGMRYEINVCAQGSDADGTANLHGQWAGQVVTILAEPSVSFGDCGFSGDGLHVAITSDYPGVNYVIFESVRAGGRELLASEHRARGDAASGVAVPAGKLLPWPADGQELDVSYRLGSDQCPDFLERHSASLTASYDSSHMLDVEPSVEFDERGLALVARVAHVGAERCWAGFASGVEEVAGEPDGTSTAFRVEMPFGAPFPLYFSSASAGGAWGTAAVEVDPAAYGVRARHAWSWGTATAELEVDLGETLATRGAIRPDAEAVSLSGRGWRNVRFSGTSSGTFEARGHLVPGVTSSSRPDFAALAAAGHAVYRSPHGDRVRVAVTGVTFAQSSRGCEVVVSMEREAV